MLDTEVGVTVRKAATGVVDATRRGPRAEIARTWSSTGSELAAHGFRERRAALRLASRGH
jgi:hypothetical protein